MIFRCDVTLLYEIYVMKFHPSQNVLGNILRANENKVHLVAVASVPFQLVY
jgi:hypothetical protein